MIPEYVIFWLLGSIGFVVWPALLILGLSNRARLIRIERALKGLHDA